MQIDVSKVVIFLNIYIKLINCNKIPNPFVTVAFY